MSVLNKIAYFQNRRDEVPNQKLAKQLVATRNKKGIREIAENLGDRNQNIQSDCLKVLYELGYLAPDLIADYVDDFLRLLKSKNNRMVWGSMIALSTIAAISVDALYPYVPEIQKAMQKGSVITVDNAVLTLAGIASSSDARRREIFPSLLDHLKTCRPKDVPQHAEKTLIAVGAENKEAFIAVLEKRMEDMAGSQAKRVRKVIKEADKR